MYPMGMPIDRLAVNFNAVPGALVCSETLLGYMRVFLLTLNKHAHANKDLHLLPLWLKVKPTHICTTSIC